MSPLPDLAYDNRTGRPPGRGVRLLGTVLRGVARVRGQADAYADHWHALNRAALAEVAAGRAGRRLIALGDSMAQGVGGSSPEAGWVGQVAARLASSGHDLTLLNLSATGARVDDVLRQQLPVLEALPPAPAGAGPDLVVAMIGSNDLFSGRRHRHALPGLMAELVDRLPHGSIVATLPQPRAAARAANRAIDAAVAAGRLRAVDLRTDGPPSWRGLVAEDYFHPNDRGYAALADAVEPVLRAALRDLPSGRLA